MLPAREEAVGPMRKLPWPEMKSSHLTDRPIRAVLDYIALLHEAHGGSPSDPLGTAASAVSALWRAHEDSLTPLLLDVLAGRDDVRLLGPERTTDGHHRCPTVAFSPQRLEPIDVAHDLVDRGIQTNAGHFYAVRVLDALGVDADRGVVRLSFVHYTSRPDVERAVDALDSVLG